MGDSEPREEADQTEEFLITIINDIIRSDLRPLLRGDPSATPAVLENGGEEGRPGACGVTLLVTPGLVCGKLVIQTLKLLQRWKLISDPL